MPPEGAHESSAMSCALSGLALGAMSVRRMLSENVQAANARLSRLAQPMSARAIAFAQTWRDLAPP